MFLGKILVIAQAKLDSPRQSLKNCDHNQAAIKNWYPLRTQAHIQQDVLGHGKILQKVARAFLVFLSAPLGFSNQNKLL